MEVPSWVVLLVGLPYAAAVAVLAALLFLRVLSWRRDAKDIRSHKFTGTLEGDFVVFMIGLKFNHDFWLHFLRNPGPCARILLAMPKILKELHEHPEYGCLSVEHTNTILTNPTHIVQIWRSYDHLLAYAQGPLQRHMPTWQRYYQDGKQFPARGQAVRAVRAAHDKGLCTATALMGAWNQPVGRARGNSVPGVGIWHETYKVAAGAYETVYVNMATHGLAAAQGAQVLTATSGRYSTSKGRMGGATATSSDTHNALPIGKAAGAVDGPAAGCPFPGAVPNSKED